MRVLIVYATSDGQTRRVARRIAAVLEQQDLSVALIDASAPHRDLAILSFDRFDAAILLGSVRMGHHQKALADFARAHRVELEAVPNAFVSVSLSAGKDKPSAKREVEKTFRDFIHRTGWRPDAEIPVAGAMLYTQYNFAIKLVMKFISFMTGGETDTSRDYEYTDWAAVEGFARRFAGALSQEAEATAAQAEIELH